MIVAYFLGHPVNIHVSGNVAMMLKFWQTEMIFFAGNETGRQRGTTE